MTRTFLLALLASLLLSGCSGDTAGSQNDASSDPMDEDLAGEQGSEDAAEGPVEYKDTVLLTVDVIVTPGTPFAQDIEVPEGALDIQAEVTGPSYNGGPQVAASLTGCGEVAGGIQAIAPGGTTSVGFGLCEEAEGGTQAFELSAPAGVMQGALTVSARVPV